MIIWPDAKSKFSADTDSASEIRHPVTAINQQKLYTSTDSCFATSKNFAVSLLVRYFLCQPPSYIDQGTDTSFLLFFTILSLLPPRLSKCPSDVVDTELTILSLIGSVRGDMVGAGAEGTILSKACSTREYLAIFLGVDDGDKACVAYTLAPVQPLVDHRTNHRLPTSHTSLRQRGQPYRPKCTRTAPCTECGDQKQRITTGQVSSGNFMPRSAINSDKNLLCHRNIGAFQSK